MNSLDDDYATPERLAIYLEIGWSDFLFATSSDADSCQSRPYPSPLHDRVPPQFPIAAVALAHDWATNISLDAKSFCDVGGATGRTVYEFERQFPGLEQLVLIEPSKRFCEWAKRLLSSEDDLPDIPTVGRKGSPQWSTAKARPSPIARADERLTIVNETLESCHPRQGFDIVTCLNVIDRHPRPSELVKEIGRLMNNNGLLILSCPFDFDEQSTPNAESWVDDLDILFEGLDAWDDVGQSELFYEFRAFNRSWTRFSSQIVGKRWRDQRGKPIH
jgi:SAM-dependent methyltransferase